LEKNRGGGKEKGERKKKRKERKKGKKEIKKKKKDLRSTRNTVANREGRPVREGVKNEGMNERAAFQDEDESF